MKVAILGASHWHVPLYLGALEEKEGVEVIAVSDAESGRGPEVAERFGARLYLRDEDLLDSEKPDFVFAFGRHCDMYRTARRLLDLGLPFSIEKPCGLNASQVRDLQEIADKRDAFVAVPLIMGYSDVSQELGRLASGTDPKWQHLSFRFIAGPLHRYSDNNCAWMLDRRLAGGGCTINLAVHFVDLIHRLTGARITDVTARMIVDTDLADVEIFSQIALRTDAGQVCTIETGYTYPGGTAEQRDFSFSLGSSRSYVRSQPDSITTVPHDGSAARHIPIGLETDVFYSTFVRDTIRRYKRGEKPASGLTDMHRSMRVIDGAYESSRRGAETVML